MEQVPRKGTRAATGRKNISIFAVKKCVKGQDPPQTQGRMAVEGKGHLPKIHILKVSSWMDTGHTCYEILSSSLGAVVTA